MFMFGYGIVCVYNGVFICLWLVMVFLFFCLWWSFYMFMFGYSIVSVYDGVFICLWLVMVFFCLWWSNLYVYVW